MCLQPLQGQVSIGDAATSMTRTSQVSAVYHQGLQTRRTEKQADRQVESNPSMLVVAG